MSLCSCAEHCIIMCSVSLLLKVTVLYIFPMYHHHSLLQKHSHLSSLSVWKLKSTNKVLVQIYLGDSPGMHTYGSFKLRKKEKFCLSTKKERERKQCPVNFLKVKT